MDRCTDTDVRILRENLIRIRAWVDHWDEDRRSNLKPTEGGLKQAFYYVENSLKALDRIEEDMRAEA